MYYTLHKNYLLLIIQYSQLCLVQQIGLVCFMITASLFDVSIQL